MPVARSGPDRGPALVVDVGIQGIEPEILLIKGLRRAGFDAIVLAQTDWPERYHRAAASGPVLRWAPELDRRIGPAHARARSAIKRIASVADLMRLELDGVRVGRVTAATALRSLRIGSLDLHDGRVRDHVVVALTRSMAAAAAAERILDAVRPGLVLMVDRGYTPAGELFDAALLRGIPVVTWNAAHRGNALVMKRYALANRDDHFASLSDASWSLMRSAAFDDGHRRQLVAEIEGCYASGDWYSEVGTQFDRRMADAATLRERLGLSGDRPVAAIFPHILWDGTFFWGTDLFGSYEEWLIETIRAAIDSPDADWILKIHPAHLVKNARDRQGGRPAEMVAISEAIGDLPEHIHVLPPDWDVNTYSLYRAIDHCFTVRGTVGIEAAALGVTVVTAGTGRYDQRGFTVDPTTRSEYVDVVRNVHRLPRPSPEQRDLAERFAYGVFLLRPLLLESVTFEFGRDARATARSAVVARTATDWESAEDLESFATWIASSAEDYLDPGRLSRLTAGQRLTG